MKNHRISKQLSDHLVAHLYEHIFFIHLDTKLREDGFVAPLDYELDATTKAGLVQISLDVYNEDLLKAIVQDIFTDLQIDFEMEVTEIAIDQISSEYGSTLEVNDPSELFEALRKVHEFSWNSDETLTVPEVLSVGGAVKRAELIISYDLNKVEKGLMPLYRQVAGMVLNVVSSDIADTYGGYVSTEAYSTDENRKLYSKIQFLESFDQSEVNIKTITHSTVEELLNSGAFDRLADMLNNIEQIKNAPSAEQTLLATDIVMTPETWREYATKENMNILLNITNDSIESYNI